MTTWALGGGAPSESAVNPGEVPDLQPVFSRLSCLLPIFEEGSCLGWTKACGLYVSVTAGCPEVLQGMLECQKAGWVGAGVPKSPLRTAVLNPVKARVDSLLLLLLLLL